MTFYLASIFSNLSFVPLRLNAEHFFLEQIATLNVVFEKDFVRFCRRKSPERGWLRNASAARLVGEKSLPC